MGDRHLIDDPRGGVARCGEHVARERQGALVADQLARRILVEGDLDLPVERAAVAVALASAGMAPRSGVARHGHHGKHSEHNHDPSHLFPSLSRSVVAQDGGTPKSSAVPYSGGMPDQRTASDRLEILATVVLGLAAIMVGWSSYQSSLWGGRQDSALTQSINTTTASTDLLQAADSTLGIDQVLFIEIFTSGACDDGGDEFVCEQIFANMSPEGTAAVEEWFDNDELAPFDSETYLDALYGEAYALGADAEGFFDDAAEANQNGDDYQLASTLITIVLFFAGISIVLTGDRLRLGLIVIGLGFLIGTGIYMATLPVA